MRINIFHKSDLGHSNKKNKPSVAKKHVALVVVCIALLFAGFCLAVPTLGGIRGGSPAKDFYYYNGHRVQLNRSNSLFSVNLAATVNQNDKSGSIGANSQSSMQVNKVSSLRSNSELLSLNISGQSSSQFENVLAGLKSDNKIQFAYPAWIDPSTGNWLLLTDEVVVQLKDNIKPGSISGLLAAHDLSFENTTMGNSREYVLRLLNPKKSDPIAVSKTLLKSGLIKWAEPNFIQEQHAAFIPNDPLFSEQWNLQNTGQDGGTVGADANITGAWNVQRGNHNTTIAVIDMGVDLNQKDLKPNIFVNQGEIPGNGIDDDNNGYVDDVNGWNFANNNNNPNPGVDNNHGTAVAGIAAARGNNGIGISGACPNCTILPIKIRDGSLTATNAQIAKAILYAGQFADVISMSWPMTSSSSAIDAAIQSVVTNGRDGKGVVMLNAAGNEASGSFHYAVSGLPAGTHKFEWEYVSGSSSASSNNDSAWLAWVRYPGGNVDTFENGTLPAGWTTSGDSNWSVVDDPTHADEGECWSHAAKAGTISGNQSTRLDEVKTTKAGSFDFMGSVSSRSPGDKLIFRVDINNDGTWDSEQEFSRVPPTNVSYPSSNPDTIAVGATSNYDCRTYYSQFGSGLDIVAPSSGRWIMPGIETTDRTGSAGYVEGDYNSDFGGTSAATPLVAGVAGLILSEDPALTSAQVRQILESTTDKVGIASYDTNGRNDRYGYGRVNAQKALAAIPVTVALSQQKYSVEESAATASVDVGINRYGPATSSTTVTLQTKDGTAKAGTDYTSTFQTITFAAGETQKTVSIPILSDPINQQDSNFTAVLSNPSGGAILGNPTSTAITIKNDNNLSLFSFSPSNYAVSESAKSATITISRSGPTSGPASVFVKTANGSATAGKDYTAVGATLNFAAGETQKTVSVPIREDSIVEGNETILLSLSEPSVNAAVGVQSSSTITILDDEKRSAVFFSSTNFTASQGSKSATITISRSGSTASPAFVFVKTANGSAIAGKDYAAVKIRVNFAKNVTSQTISIPILNNAARKSDRTINLTLSNKSSNVTLGTQKKAILTIRGSN